VRGEGGERSEPGEGEAPSTESPPHPRSRIYPTSAADSDRTRVDPSSDASGERERTEPAAASGLEPRKTLKNICCVGDDDQPIYGWRGAEVDNILGFEHDFPGARIIRLERNYRSTAHILAAASRLIAHNQGRLGKTLRTEDEPGEKVKVTSCWDSKEEARAIGEEIEQLQADDGRCKPHPLER